MLLDYNKMTDSSFTPSTSSTSTSSTPLSNGISYFGTWVTAQYTPNFAKGVVNAIVDRANGTATFTMRYTGTYNCNLVRHLTASISRPEGSYITTAATSGCIFNAIGVLNQHVLFTTTTFTDNEISGTYTTVNPEDFGTFTMKTSSLSKEAEAEVSEAKCTIM